MRIKTRNTLKRLKKANKLRISKDKKSSGLFYHYFLLISDKELELINIFQCDACTTCNCSKWVLRDMHWKLRFRRDSLVQTTKH